MKEVNIPHDVWQASLQRVKRGLVFVEPVLVGSQDELLRGARGLCKRGCGRQQVKSRARPDSEGGLALAPSRCRAQAQRQRQAQSRPALPVSVNAPPGYTTAPDPVKLIQVNHRCPFSRASLVRWGAESCHELLFLGLPVETVGGKTLPALPIMELPAAGGMPSGLFLRAGGPCQLEVAVSVQVRARPGRSGRLGATPGRARRRRRRLRAAGV